MRICAGLAVSCSFMVFACGPTPTGDLQSSDVKALDVYTVLHFLNGAECTVETLTQEIGVRATAARNIVAHVRGPDGQRGTRDDNPFDSIDELDAVPQVGPATIAAIDAYLSARNTPDDVVVEGVSLSFSVAQQIVVLCNSATQSLLDNEVGLDARAADAIVAARPLADIEAVAAVSYVGGSAIARLRDYVIAHPQAVPTPAPAPRPPPHVAPVQILSADASDSTHVVITFSHAIDPATPDSAFSIFIGEPDAGGLSLGIVSIQGAVVTLETEEQEDLEYTLEAVATLLDDAGQPIDPNGRWARFDGVVAAAPPSPAGIDCTTLSGGTFDGIAYSASEECQAVQFLNRARFSEMGAMIEAGRRVAYDCAPDGSCGFRASAWSRLSEFASFAGVGATSMRTLKTAMTGWSENGLPYDTVASVWQQRAALVDQPINLDNVILTRRVPDQVSDSTYFCVELRDQVGAPNFITACIRWVNADSAPGCSGYPPLCFDPAVGTRVSMRGTWRASSQSPGGYRLVMNATGPSAPNPNVP